MLTWQTRRTAMDLTDSEILRIHEHLCRQPNPNPHPKCNLIARGLLLGSWGACGHFLRRERLHTARSFRRRWRGTWDATGTGGAIGTGNRSTEACTVLDGLRQRFWNIWFSCTGLAWHWAPPYSAGLTCCSRACLSCWIVLRRSLGLCSRLWV